MTKVKRFLREKCDLKFDPRRGFTMTELLVVIAILSIIMLMVLFAVWRTQAGKARDARRKADLYDLREGFEDYFNDNGCYPPADALDQCNALTLQPYVGRIPCDPLTGESYDYHVDSECRWFQVYTDLETDSDKAIDEVNCRGGCGSDGLFDYGVTSGVATQSLAGSGLVGPPPPPGGPTFACDPQGACNIYANPEAAGCPVWFGDGNLCQGYCDANSAYWCDQ